jgi:predicted nucleic acid-binding protein
MSGRSFLDTNVLVYLFDGDSAEKQARARELLRDLGPSGDLALSTQVLQEFYVSVTRKLAVPLSTEEAERAVRELIALPVAHVDPQTVLSAIALSRQHTVSFWDALIVQAALDLGCDRVLTEDMPHGRTFGALRIENPFHE